MSPTVFDHELRRRLMRFRQALNRSAQTMNHCTAAMERMALDARKCQLRLEASSNRLANCMRAHGI